MKRPIMSAISKLTLGVVLFTGALSANAQAKFTSSTEKTAEVKYVGNSEDAVLFNVSYINPSSGKFFVAVLDEDGTQLFQGAYSDQKFDKRFLFPKTDKHKLTFVIRNAKEIELKQTFEINTRYVEDVVVTKI
jgi:hypothetical protein